MSAHLEERIPPTTEYKGFLALNVPNLATLSISPCKTNLPL